MSSTNNKTISQCGRIITAKEIDLIKETVELFPQLSRTELTETICEHLSWHSPSGKNKLDACEKLLLKLEKDQNLKLPKIKEQKRIKPYKKKIEFTTNTEPQDALICNLSDLGPISLEIANDKNQIALWNEYMSRYHYLGTVRPFGCFIRYFFKCDKYGILGCCLYAGPAKSMGLRDKWIGWNHDQRLKNLSWIANNSRFLILPWVKVKNFASHVLGKITKNIANDWNDKWEYKPVLLETFVDPTYYLGTCYKAANWQYIGMTTGTGLVRKNKKYTTTPKQIYMMPLTKNFKKILCQDDLKGNIIE